MEGVGFLTNFVPILPHTVQIQSLRYRHPGRTAGPRWGIAPRRGSQRASPGPSRSDVGSCESFPRFLWQPATAACPSNPQQHGMFGFTCTRRACKITLTLSRARTRTQPHTNTHTHIHIHTRTASACHVSETRGHVPWVCMVWRSRPTTPRPASCGRSRSRGAGPSRPTTAQRRRLEPGDLADVLLLHASRFGGSRTLG